MKNKLAGGRKRSWPTRIYHSGICLERMKKTMKCLREDSWCPDQDLNRAPPEYKPEASPLKPDCFIL
jgi:hypothetical protein